MNKIINSDRTKGIAFIILSALGFALMSACVKLAGDLPNFQKVFFRNLVSAIIALYLILKHKGSFTGKRESRNLLLMRSTFGTIGVILNFFIVVVISIVVYVYFYRS